MEIDKLKEIAQKVETSRSQIQNEQATKTAFIMPFLQAWGYDVFNPMEVHPEYILCTATTCIFYSRTII